MRARPGSGRCIFSELPLALGRDPPKYLRLFCSYSNKRMAALRVASPCRCTTVLHCWCEQHTHACLQLPAHQHHPQQEINGSGASRLPTGGRASPAAPAVLRPLPGILLCPLHSGFEREKYRPEYFPVCSGVSQLRGDFAWRLGKSRALVELRHDAELSGNWVFEENALFLRTPRMFVIKLGKHHKTVLLHLCFS